MKKKKNPKLKPLDGITVADFSRLLPGPFASLILSDLGARVVKVELKERPDDLKTYPPLNKKGEGVLYFAFNRGKKIQTLSLEKDRAQILALLKKSDVMLESYRPGVLKKMGLDAQVLLKKNKRLLIASLTGFGQSGPLSKKAGHDLNFLSLAGLSSDGHQPSIQWADLVGGGLMAVISILAALIGRSKTGKGGVIDVSMTDSLIFLNLAMLVKDQFTSDQGLFGGVLGRYRFYKTKDGRLVFFGGLESKFWNQFVDHAGLDSALKDHPAGLYADKKPDVHRKIEEIFASKTFKEWEKVAMASDFCLTPVLNSSEVIRSSQFHKRGFFVKKQGKVFPTFPLRFPL